MAKSRPARPAKESRKGKSNSILHGTHAPRSKPSSQKQPAPVNPSLLLSQATSLLHTGQPSSALPIAVRALSLLHPTAAPAEATPAALPALTLLAEIHIELGDAEAARSYFLQAVDIDAEGLAPDGAEKFLWVAQLCEEGGEESVRWFERGAGVLRREIAAGEGKAGRYLEVEEKKRRLAGALCGVAEVWMTDLSWDPSAESNSEAFVTEALLVAPLAPEPLQTLASVRISQQRIPDAKAALARSMELWVELPPEDPHVPEFATRISLARLLMEVGMEGRALEVLERLVGEEDGSVEAWYLGGWCLFLMGEGRRKPGGGGGGGGRRADEGVEGEAMGEGEDWRGLWASSREWLRNGLKLYEMQEYEDDRLRDHAVELVVGLNAELGEVGENEEEEEGGEWEDEEDEGDEDDDQGGGDLKMDGT
ncbi:Tetratricopeptide-like helical domain [Lasallia pustulata]|uniref:Tetratricopeptide-like helical domain n=1 Tax=Lasallia pustulata TaxID=136370 RepID=A0A1W5CW79_9LECA|nr:Tetratricopeptide-like helical domain [Lasallia pustulata]